MYRLLLPTLCAFLALAAVSTASPRLPQRIASGTVGSDEILVALLAKRNELARLVAVSSLATDPRYSLLGPLPPTLSGRVGSSLEALLALRPDLAILASYNRLELAKQLRAAGVDVHVQSAFNNLEDVLRNIQTIAQLVGATSQGDEMVAAYRRQLKDWAAARGPCTPERSPTLLQYSDHDMLPGSATIFDDAALHAGFRNLAAAKGLKGWAPLSLEVLVQLNPDWIVVAGEDAKRDTILQQLRSARGWATLPAVKEGKLIVVKEALLSSVSHHTLELVGILSRHFACRRP